MNSLAHTVDEPRTARRLRIRQCEKGDAQALALVHVENLSGRFGLALTKAYYQACLESEQQLFICAEQDGTIVGFLGLVGDRIQVIKLLLTGRALVALAGAALRPSLVMEYFRHLWRWMRVRNFSRRLDLPRWEYRPVVVAQAYRSKGVATHLLAAADRMLDSRGVTKVFLQVASTNAGALLVYQKSGFKIRLAHSSTIFMIKDLAGQHRLR
jgi:ribosomal protein S18 acetylase RimI-like enzyme